MKQFLLLPLLLTTMALATLQAQPDQLEWVKPIGLFSNPDEAFTEPIDFFVDPAGNSNVLLYTETTLVFENGQSIVVEEEVPHFIYVKYNTLGELLSVKSFGGVTNNNVFDRYSGKITGDNNGNIYVASNYDKAIDFGNNIAIDSPTCNCMPLFIVKYNPAGEAVWAKTMESTALTSVFPVGIGCDAVGNIYTALSTAQSSITYGNTTLTNTANGSQFLCKLDANGGLIWGKTMAENSAAATPFLFSVSPNGDSYISGEYEDAIDFGENIGLAPDNPDQQYHYLVRYDANGTPNWANSLSSNGYLDILDIEADAMGKLYIGLDFNENLLLENQTILTTTSAFAGAMLVLADTLTTTPLFVPYEEDSYPFSALAVTDGGKYYTGGYVFDAEIVIDNNIITTIDCADIVIVEGNGNAPVTAYNIGGNGCEGIINFSYGNAMDIDANGDLYITGIFVDGGTVGGQTLNQSGLFVAKLNTGTSSTKTPAIQPSIAVMPNPNTGSFKVDFKETPQNGRLVVMDIAGKILYEQHNIQNQQIAVEVSLPNGQYFLQLADGNQSATIKMSVLR